MLLIWLRCIQKSNKQSVMYTKQQTNRHYWCCHTDRGRKQFTPSKKYNITNFKQMNQRKIRKKMENQKQIKTRNTTKEAIALGTTTTKN